MSTSAPSRAKVSGENKIGCGHRRSIGRCCIGYAEAMKHIAGVFIVVAVIIAGVPSSGWAQWGDFVPRLIQPGASLDVNLSFSSTDSSGSGRSVNSQYFLSGEQLTLFTNGYSYDPRFVLFRASLGIGLQQRYQSQYSDAWNTGEANQYRFDVLMFDRHPYTLNFYIYRIKPIAVGYDGVEAPNAQTGKGAIFRYKKRPYFFLTSYTTTSYDASQGESTSEHYKVSAAYLKDFTKGNSLYFGGGYAHNDYSAPQTPSGHTNYYNFYNSISVNSISVPVSLLSTVSENDNRQGTFTGSTKNSILSWGENLNASLPWNFNTGLGWSYSKNKNNVEDSQVPSNELSATDRGFAFNLGNRLYQSLVTQYNFSKSWASSSSGDTDQTTNQVTASYAKTIPWGTLLMGGSFQRITVDNSGETQIVNEPHQTAVPGFFNLSNQNPDPTTLRIYVKYPVEPVHYVLLQYVTNYNYIIVGNTLQINITSLPSEFVGPGPFDFFVDYSVQKADYNLQSDSWSYNIGFNLFDNLLYPYYNYLSVSSELLSGSLPGGAPPLDSTTNVVGLVVTKNPYQASIQYRNTDSNAGSNDAWRAEVTYNNAVTETARVYATAQYEVINYPTGTSVQSMQSYTEKIASLSANLMKQLPYKGMTLTAGGSFSYLKSLSTSTAYGVNSSLLWIIGKLTLSAGANIYFTESQSSVDVHTLHQTYYLNIKRAIY
jgi:hypothetical protein